MDLCDLRVHLVCRLGLRIMCVVFRMRILGVVFRMRILGVVFSFGVSFSDPGCGFQVRLRNLGVVFSLLCARYPVQGGSLRSSRAPVVPFGVEDSGFCFQD